MASDVLPRAFAPGGVFVLGGTGGIGQAICLAFADAGLPVGLSYRSRREGADRLCEEVAQRGMTARAWQLDASDHARTSEVLAEAADALGGLAAVVYAGGPSFAPEFFSAIAQATWRDWLDGDVLAAANLAQAAIPHLRRTRGALVALSTYQGQRLEVRGGISAISKAAIDRMIAVIAKEEGRYGVRANAVRCGWVETPLNDRLLADRPALARAKRDSIPLGRLGRPDEIAQTVVFLCSQGAGFVTGAVLTADGGESL